MTVLKIVRPPSTEGLSVREKIEQRWRDRVKAQGMKPGTKGYRHAEMEFFVGAMAAIEAMHPGPDEQRMSPQVPPIWIIHLMSGRPVVEDLTELTKGETT